MNKAEALSLANLLEEIGQLEKAKQPKHPSWFQGDASQVQGFRKWAVVKDGDRSRALPSPVLGCLLAAAW